MLKKLLKQIINNFYVNSLITNMKKDIIIMILKVLAYIVTILLSYFEGAKQILSSAL